MKHALTFAAGLLFGVVLTAVYLGRYTISTAAAGSTLPIIHAYRLDHFTGEVIGIGGFGLAEAGSIPAWHTAPNTFTFEQAQGVTNSPNPYLDLIPATNRHLAK